MPAPVKNHGQRLLQRKNNCCLRIRRRFGFFMAAGYPCRQIISPGGPAWRIGIGHRAGWRPRGCGQALAGVFESTIRSRSPDSAVTLRRNTQMAEGAAVDQW